MMLSDKDDFKDKKVDPLNLQAQEVDEMARIRSASLKFLVFFCFAFATNYVSNQNAEEDKKLNSWDLLTTSFSHIWSFIGGGFLMASVFRDLPQELYSLLVPYLPKRIQSKDYLIYEKTLTDYMAMRDNLSEDDKKYMDQAILDLRASAVGVHKDSLKVFTSIINYLNMIMLINDAKNYVGIDYAQRFVLTKEFDELFFTYPHVKESLMNYLRALISSDLAKIPNRPQTLLFVGPPGVGKTDLAGKLFKPLKFNIHEIKIEELLKEFKPGYGNKNHYVFELQQSSPFVQGIYKSRAQKGSSKYTVILIDEIDKLFRVDQNGELTSDYPALVTKFLELCDPNKRYFHDTSINADLDMQHTLVIFLANQNVFAKSPMARRLLTVIFPPMQMSLKITIANNKISDLCQELQIALNPAEQQYLDDLIESNDKDGVGELLEDIKNFLQNLRSVSVFKNTSWELSSEAMLTQYSARLKSLTEAVAEPLNEAPVDEQNMYEEQYIKCSYW